MQRSLFLSAVAIAAAAPIPFDGVIRANADGTLYSFFSPPYSSNHASFLEVSSAGLVCAWFSGADEGANETAIVVSVLRPNATAWSTAQVVSRHSGFSCQNPVLWQAPAGRLYLWHTCQPAQVPPNEERATIWQSSSPDGGLTWEAGSDMPWWTAHGAFTRNRVFQHYNGSLSVPAYNASTAGTENYSTRITLDSPLRPALPLPANTTWAQHTLGGTDNRVQPSWVQLGGHGNLSVVSFFRDRQSKSIYRSLSADGGFTWPAPTATCLPNNNAAIQAASLSSGAIALVFDNSTGPRFPLLLALSYDAGVTWPYARALQYKEDNATSSDPLPLGNATEWSYPTLLQTAGTGLIHVAHTYNRWTIKYHVVSEEWVREGGTRLC